MANVYRVKNASGVDGTWVGQDITNGAYYDLTETELPLWRSDTTVFQDVGNGNLVVNRGQDTVDDIADPIEGWNYLYGDTLPKSSLGGVDVHPNFKPVVPGKTLYAVWTGAGDDITTGTLGGNGVCELNCTTGQATTVKEIKFDPQFGDVYVHEGYASWENANAGDHLNADFVAPATPLQTTVNLDLEVDASNWIKYAAGGAGTGTHGWADANKIYLIPRSFSKDGDWDYDGTNLTPNTSGTGGYKISDIERTLHRFMQKVPVRGSSYGFLQFTSNDTIKLAPGYFIRVTAHNVSDTVWFATLILEVYRERTYLP